MNNKWIFSIFQELGFEFDQYSDKENTFRFFYHCPEDSLFTAIVNINSVDGKVYMNLYKYCLQEKVYSGFVSSPEFLKELYQNV